MGWFVLNTFIYMFIANLHFSLGLIYIFYFYPLNWENISFLEIVRREIPSSDWIALVCESFRTKKIDVFSSKIYLGLLALGFCRVTIQLFPISKQASSWNRCLRKTSETLTQVKAVKKMNDESKEVLSVMICNGAVFKPNIKTNIQ